MNNKNVEKDERTTYFENISYKFGYIFITFALLLDVAYRSLILGEAPWDLLGIVIISGLVLSSYQYKQKILGKAWMVAVFYTVVVSRVLCKLENLM